MTEREKAIIVWFLDHADRDEREFIAGMAMAAALQTHPPHRRRAVLAQAFQRYSDALDDDPTVPP